MYATDLAHAHDAGFSSFAAKSAPAVARLLRGHRDVVELGCGSGVLAAYLTARRHRYVGIDISPAMVRLARARAPGGRFKVASIGNAALPVCDAIVALGEVVTYVPGGLPALARFFRRAHRALRPGGLLVFDFMASARGRTYAPRLVFGDGWTLEVAARVDRGSRVLTRDIRILRRVGRTVRASRETHRIHIYDRTSLTAALRRSGFAVALRRSLGPNRLLPGDVAVIARKMPRI